MTVATITLESGGDSVVVSSPSQEFLNDDIVLDTAPDGIYDTGFTVRTQSGAFEIGGRIIGEEVPIRQMTLPFWLTPQSRPRFQKLWGTPGNFKKVRWHYDGPSGRRSLTLRLAKEILYETEDGHDASIDSVYHAVVVALAVNPMYESAEDVQEWANPSTDTNTGYFSVWNPTDQNLWLEWSFDPATSWSFPDFSFGQERKWGRAPGVDAARMIVTPALTQLLSVMSDPIMDTYVNADLSNAAGLFNGVEPLYAVPPYTANEASPLVVPIVCNGPAGATATLRMRRYWSAESGLEL
ncbi:hypothetical protein [Mycolicibacterium sp.]|uniref:hypothetical protein n=1 Tax=Mycolicibacterium sp. TaxID=2320850 RepID=UPI0028AF3E21|nr:hypothetical protein [Mycolicibacterium sp.]